MSLTTFSGPVRSLNGFITGSAADPIVATTAGNISSSYGTASNTTGDVRLSYNRLTFTSTGSGETIRALTQVTGANAATGGTVRFLVLVMLCALRWAAHRLTQAVLFLLCSWILTLQLAALGRILRTCV